MNTRGAPPAGSIAVIGKDRERGRALRHPHSADLFAWIILILMVAAAAGLFSWLAVARHDAFQSHAFDLGNMQQAVWNTLHGRILRFTDMAVGSRVLTSRLAIHVEPLLVLLAPLALIGHGPEALLITQAVVVAAGAVPAYALARLAGAGPFWALSVPLAYLLHPSLQNVVLDDFHAVALSPTFLLWTLYFALRGAVLPYAIFAMLAATTKEEVGLVVAGVGLIWLWHRRFAIGLATIVLCAGWFVVCVAVIIPHFNPQGHSPYLQRYAYLGHGLSGIVRGAVTHPVLVWHTLTSTGRQEYVLDILRPLAFLPLLALPFLLLALPAVLINLLSADPSMYSGFYQYSAEVAGIAVGAAALGLGAFLRLARRGRARGVGPAFALLLATAAIMSSRQYGFTPLAEGYITPGAGAHQSLEDRLISTIPSDAVVAAADEIEPHLADRQWIYLLPTVHPSNGPAARYIVLDASVPSSPIEPHTLYAVARRALASGYGIEHAEDGVLILRRGGTRQKLPAAFYRFAFTPASRSRPRNVAVGPLRLLDAVVYPRDGQVNRSRPAIGVQSDWRADPSLPAGTRIVLAVSPVYRGARPMCCRGWIEQPDSPTLAWLPPARWPRGRTVDVAFVPVAPEPYRSGSVDVDLRIFVPEHGARTIRLATIAVDG